MVLERTIGENWSLRIDMLVACALYVVILKTYQYLFIKKSTEKGSVEPHPAYSWPLPGPYKNWGILGKTIPYITFYGSTLLTLFNPFLLVQQFRMILGQSKTSVRVSAMRAEISNYKTKVNYRLPVDGEWLVYHGGHTPNTSHSWDVLNQRYAYDFVKADSEYNRHSGKGNQLSDYYCYQQPIRAAADGEVISVVNNIGDAPFVGYMVMDFLTRGIAGNHIVIKHAEGEFGFYAHLIKGSIPLKKGDKVKQGELIGLCGHSGNSSEPHLHFHLQDTSDFFSAMGLPIKFDNIRIDNTYVDKNAIITRGSRVEYSPV